jgi:hypothetical protein
MDTEGKPCQIPAGFAIVRLPDEMIIQIEQLGSSETMMQKKEVDEISEMLHTLPPSLLMNTTLHRDAASSTEQVL